MTANTTVKQTEITSFKAVAYGRLSKEHDRKNESDSIENQLKLIRAYVEKHPNIELVDELRDEGYTGTNYDRPGFRGVLKAIESGRANCVIVKDLSRLGREYIETGKYLETIFPALGVRFIAINDDVDSSVERSGDDLIIPIKNIMNESYCRELSRKLRAQFRIQRGRGEFLGAFACFGYLKDAHDKHKLVVDDYAAEVVRSIFALKLRGYSQDAIARFLNSEGIPAPAEYKRSMGLKYKTGFSHGKSASWTPVAVTRILKNRVYTGTLIQGRRGTPNYKLKQMRERDESEWVVVENNHEAIVDSLIFALIQRLLERDTRTSPGCETVFPLAGALFCPDCGRAMQRRSVERSGHRYNYYVCSTYKNGRGCSGHSIEQSKLESAVLHSIQGQINVIAEVSRLRSSLGSAKIKAARAKKLDSLISQCENELDRSRQFRARLYEALSDGLIDRDEYSTMRRRYSEQIEAAQNRLDNLNRQRESALSDAESDESWIAQFLKFSSLKELSREAVVTMIDRIYVYDGSRIRIDFNFRDELAACLELLGKETG